MNKLFITIKDRPTELTILCKSLLHSDMRNHIKEVIFLDDNSDDQVAMQRIYNAFMYMLLPMGIKCRYLEARDGREGINESWDRIKHYPSKLTWGINGDMMVFENYFQKCTDILEFGQQEYGYNSSLLVSGFNTPMHPVEKKHFNEKCVKAPSVGGCAFVMHNKDVPVFLQALGKPTMNRGFDMHLGEVFNTILTSDPSVSQHLGFFTGLNQLHLSGFPGAFARVRG
jgi:hypothetical protein